jgi:hypothetical protein
MAEREAKWGVASKETKDTVGVIGGASKPVPIKGDMTEEEKKRKRAERFGIKVDEPAESAVKKVKA